MGEEISQESFSSLPIIGYLNFFWCYKNHKKYLTPPTWKMENPYSFWFYKKYKIIETNSYLYKYRKIDNIIKSCGAFVWVVEILDAETSK